MTDILTIVATVIGVAFAMKYFNKKNVVEKPKAPTPDEFKKMTDAEKLNEWRKKWKNIKKYVKIVKNGDILQIPEIQTN